MAPPNFIQLYSGKVNRGALASVNFIASGVMILNSTNTDRKCTGLNFDGITNVQSSTAYTAGYDRTVTLDGKSPIDRHPKRSLLAVGNFRSGNFVSRITDGLL
jgi:hypothetical protein